MSQFLFGSGDVWMGIITVIVVIFFIVVIIRELVTWYLKLNKIVDLLEKIEENTRTEIVQDKI